MIQTITQKIHKKAVSKSVSLDATVKNGEVEYVALSVPWVLGAIIIRDASALKDIAAVCTEMFENLVGEGLALAPTPTPNVVTPEPETVTAVPTPEPSLAVE